MSGVGNPQIAVEPESWRRERLVRAVAAGGGSVVAPTEAEGLVWVGVENPAGLGELMAPASQLRWVQLPYAGIEPYLDFLDLGEG